MRVDRLMRACTPSPGPWTTFRGQRLKLGPVRLAPDAERLAPGVVAAGKNTVLVGTATHPVELGEAQPQGKRLMTAGEWAKVERVTRGVTRKPERSARPRAAGSRKSRRTRDK